MPEPQRCGACLNLHRAERADFYPAQTDCWCVWLKQWIGFIDVRIDGCQPLYAAKQLELFE